MSERQELCDDSGRQELCDDSGRQELCHDSERHGLCDDSKLVVFPLVIKTPVQKAEVHQEFCGDSGRQELCRCPPAASAAWWQELCLWRVVFYWCTV